MVILTMENIISNGETLEVILVVGDDDAVSVVLHVEEVVDDFDVVFLM